MATGHSQAPWIRDLSVPLRVQLNLLKGLINNQWAPEQMEVVPKGIPAEGGAHGSWAEVINGIKCVLAVWGF